MLRTFLSAFRRRPPTPAAAPVLAEPAEAIEFLDVPLPHRTPGLAVVRRRAYTASRHALAAIRDMNAWHDTESPDEAHVREVAAFHQLDTALEELARARAILSRLTKEPTP